MQQENLVIIGSGPAGWTAGIYAARANLNPLLLAGLMPGGLLMQTSEVENFPGFPKGINGFELMDNMQQQAERFQTRVEYDVAEVVRLTDGGKHYIKTAGGLEIEAKAVIISTGASPRWLGIPSEAKYRNHGVSACATCDGAFYKDVPVIVVGGGDSAMEEALFLTRFASKVYVVHRRHELRASRIMAERAMQHPKIEFVWDSVVDEITGDDSVRAVRVKNLLTNDLREIPCEGVFAALGHVPNTELFKEYLPLDEKGYIVLSGATSHTGLKGVFAAGDCADPHYRQAITAAAMGCRAAIDAERYLAE
ncbi:MAG: thioredoxin-disulfide reductase [Lentisphaeria bacterium]|nr:thioredoxin-disulfide reductase [Lentisphaeria bacterium]